MFAFTISHIYVTPYVVEGRHIDFGSDLVGFGVVVVVLLLLVGVTLYLVCTLETTILGDMFSYEII